MKSANTTAKIALQRQAPQASRGADNLPSQATEYDWGSFEQVYEAHYTVIGNYIYRRTMNEYVTEDLLADVFLAVMQRLDRFQERGVPIRAWLYRIANNLINQWIRREQREQRRRRAKAEMSKCAVKSDNTSDPEPAELVRKVNMLSPRHREGYCTLLL